MINRNPSGPFTTSTLQQTASSRLGFGASRTMQIAQKLYQGIEIEGETIGLITYMRTDGTNLSKDAVSAFRDYIKKEIGNEYLPENALNYSGKKAKNAQEAHEAIRPTDIIRSPQSVKKYLSTDQNKLYICGDILHSRVARSNIYLLNMLGAEVNIIAPTNLMPKEIEKFGVNVFTDILILDFGLS